jgi:hypothetical protein
MVVRQLGALRGLVAHDDIPERPRLWRGRPLIAVLRTAPAGLMHGHVLARTTSNVRDLVAAASCSDAFCASRTSIGSWPLAICWRHALDKARVSARPKVCEEPKPIHRSLRVAGETKRWYQDALIWPGVVLLSSLIK